MFLKSPKAYTKFLDIKTTSGFPFKKKLDSVTKNDFFSAPWTNCIIGIVS